MNLFVVALLLAYLLGSVSGSLLVGRFFQVDIRTRGSGNAGATNALRTMGWKFALAVALIDVGKGVAAALLLPRLGVPAGWNAGHGGLACGLAAAFGHCFPIWHGFRGGKGAGTLFGAMLVLFPGAALAAFGAWWLVLLCTGYVGLGTVIAALSLLPALWLGGADALLMGLALVSVALLVWMHRGNLARLRAGTEPRFERIRLLRRR